MQVLTLTKLSLKPRLSKTGKKYIYNSPKGWMCVVPTGYQTTAGPEMTLSWLCEGRGHFLGVTNIWRSTNREQSPCWENAWALSLSHCVTQTYSTSPWGVCGWVCMWFCLCTCAHTWMRRTKIHNHISTLSKLLCLWRNSSAEPKFQPDWKQRKWRILSWAEICLVSYMGLLINQPGCQHCIATTSDQARLSLCEPRTDTTRPFMAATGMECDVEWGEGTLAPQYCFEPARLM